MKIANTIRIILRKSALLYSVASSSYHALKNLLATLNALYLGVAYFPPRRAAHPESQSQFGQDIALEQLGLLKRGGQLVEVGCNHPKANSNSYYLEKNWGYSCICIDPVNYSDSYSEIRPSATFLNLAIDAQFRSVTLYQVEKNSGWEDQMSSLHSSAIRHGRGFESCSRVVGALPLSEVCKDLKSFDLLLLDVEGHELNVLESLGLNELRPSVLLTENNGQFFPKKQLRDYLSSFDYKLVALIGSSDEVYVDSLS